MLVPERTYDRVENIHRMADNLYYCSAKEQNLGDITAWSSQALNDITYAAMKKAYAMADVAPADVNVAEIHDWFTVAAAIGTEVIGKAAPGKGARYWLDGKANVDGECAINMSGG